MIAEDTYCIDVLTPVQRATKPLLAFRASARSGRSSVDRRRLRRELVPPGDDPHALLVRPSSDHPTDATTLPLAWPCSR